VTHASTLEQAPVARASGKVFRPDIEGLRAVAVLSVLIYHAGLAWTPGGYVGVDIFFVISGFLITSLMVREVERSGRLSLLGFWARRARRLLPASTLVLAFSAVVSFLWLPVTSRKDFGGDIVASAFYVVNWRRSSTTGRWRSRSSSTWCGRCSSRPWCSCSARGFDRPS
jgi:peptidoglycan/LPS O-acetylase OafA/YrhL